MIENFIIVKIMWISNVWFIITHGNNTKTPKEGFWIEYSLYIKFI